MLVREKTLDIQHYGVDYIRVEEWEVEGRTFYEVRVRVSQKVEAIAMEGDMLLGHYCFTIERWREINRQIEEFMNGSKG